MPSVVKLKDADSYGQCPRSSGSFTLCKTLEIMEANYTTALAEGLD